MEALKQHILNKFSNFSVADAFSIVVLATVITFILIYCKRHDARILSVIWVAYYLLAAALSLSFGFSDAAQLILIGFPALFVVLLFGQELRREIFKASWKTYSNYLHSNMVVDLEEVTKTIQQIVRATQSMSKQDVGALIIIVPDTISDHILESGTRMQADVSSELLESIFFKNAPLHDGAVIIKGNKILAAGCYLPLSQSTNIPKELGTRHRGAIGMTEVNPSVTAIVVSEETGIISAMCDGKIKRYLDSETLTSALEAAFMLNNGASQKTFWRMDIREED